MRSLCLALLNVLASFLVICNSFHRGNSLWLMLVFCTVHSCTLLSVSQLSCRLGSPDISLATASRQATAYFVLFSMLVTLILCMCGMWIVTKQRVFTATWEDVSAVRAREGNRRWMVCEPNVWAACGQFRCWAGYGSVLGSKAAQSAVLLCPWHRRGWNADGLPDSSSCFV